MINQLDNLSLDPLRANELILETCHEFANVFVQQRSHSIDVTLMVAERMIEQILSHFGTLTKASEALQPFCSNGAKLPSQVLTTLSYAAVRDHSTLGVLLDEIHELYFRVHTSEIHALRAAFNDYRVRKMPILYLWDNEGVMRYQPASYKLMRPLSFREQVNVIFNHGTSGVLRLQSYYPQMNQNSRILLDLEMAHRVYREMKPDDDPVRIMLKSTLDPVAEAKVRIRMMMDSEISSEPNDAFMKRLSLAFDLVDTLPQGKADKALVGLSDAITDFIGRDDELINDVEPVDCMIAVLSRASSHGFDPLPVLAKALGFEGDSSQFIPRLFESIDLEPPFDTTKSIVLEAVLISTQEDLIIAQNPSALQLGWLSRKTGSAKYREALKKTSLGREIVFGQDLGL